MSILTLGSCSRPAKKKSTDNSALRDVDVYVFAGALALGNTHSDLREATPPGARTYDIKEGFHYKLPRIFGVTSMYPHYKI